MLLKQTKINKIEYIAPSWKQMGELIFELGKQIIKSEKKYDWIISIAKGGWTWSRSLADYLDMDNLASVKAKLYTDIGQTSQSLILEQALPETVDIKDKNILIFDDVADSGKTLAAVKDYLIEAGAKSTETASLFYKPISVIIPNFYSFQTSAWIIFPHEIREFIHLSSKKWKKSGFSKKEILDSYKKIGLPKNQVKFFLDAK